MSIGCGPFDSRRLLIEGWRFIHHSYALVAQSHCLCLLRRPDIALRFRDLPYHYDSWRRTPGIFSPEQEAALAAIAAPDSEYRPQATLNMQAERPDFSPPLSGLKFVFGTPEYRVLREENLAGIRSAAEVPDTIHIVTPSRWTALAYERFGFATDRIHIVPHGIDPSLLHPHPQSRSATRAFLGVEGEFVFMSVGAMTGNKGIDLLLHAFARVLEVEPNVRLVLKGADGLYASREFVRRFLADMPAHSRERVIERLIYNGDTFSARDMASFLRAADCYVAPYLAEGFNNPALEASACGVASILTAGGPTDEFTDPSFAARIRSHIVTHPINERETLEALQPDLEHLIELMRKAARDPDQTRARGVAAARYAHAHFTWERVTELLLDALFGVG